MSDHTNEIGVELNVTIAAIERHLSALAAPDTFATSKELMTVLRELEPSLDSLQSARTVLEAFGWFEAIQNGRVHTEISYALQ